MQELFITNIQVGKVRNLENFDIMLSDNERRHLILTGKNGSGKTSLLDAMKDHIALQTHYISHDHADDTIESFPVILVNGVAVTNNVTAYDLKINYNYSSPQINDYIFAHIPAERQKLIMPTTIAPVNIKGKTAITINAGSAFLKYILHLDYRLYGARTDGNKQLEENLEKWFANFLAMLREIYNCQELDLQRDTKNLAFKIIMPGYEPFGLNEMADGYSALLNIVMELLMRMDDENAVVNYEKSGIAFIDEMETHLHVELQKRVLPFLTGLFPNVQFIVTTHSPFVITSLGSAVVYDIERKERLENPSAYSYETVVESYFDTDMYSNEMKKVFKRYKELYSKERSPEEEVDFLKTKTELELVPPASKELYFAFREMENKRKASENGKN